MVRCRPMKLCGATLAVAGESQAQILCAQAPGAVAITRHDSRQWPQGGFSPLPQASISVPYDNIFFAVPSVTLAVESRTGNAPASLPYSVRLGSVLNPVASHTGSPSSIPAKDQNTICAESHATPLPSVPDSISKQILPHL